MRPQSYIGVTGFMTRDEVLSILSGMPAGRLLMVGVLASAKTMRGEPNSWPNRFPPVDQIGEIFVEDPRALNLIHFATDDQATLDKQLLHLIERTGGNFDGFQLNMVWPDPLHLRILKEGRGACFVLQIGKRAFEQVNNDPAQLAHKLHAYHDVVADILFDLSGGHGRELDAQKTLAVLHAVHAEHPRLGLGVAGGIIAETIHLIEPIIREFPNVNIDAEGKIRDNKEARLNLQKTAHYIGKATRAFHARPFSHTPS